MKIIKHGKLFEDAKRRQNELKMKNRRRHRIIDKFVAKESPYECKNCGCIFSFDSKDVKIEDTHLPRSLVDLEFIVKIECPECKHTCL